MENASKAIGIAVGVLLFIIAVISTIVMPSSIARWAITGGVAVPVLMNAGVSPEFTQVVYRFGECMTLGLTPLFAYFVIYLGFVGLYSRSDFSINKCYKNILPYFVTIIVLWLFIIFGWYILGSPIGPNSYPII